MGHVRRVKVLDGADHLVKPAIRRRLLDHPVVLYVTQQIFLVDPLHEDEQIISISDDAVNWNDVRVRKFLQDAERFQHLAVAFGCLLFLADDFARQIWIFELHLT